MAHYKLIQELGRGGMGVVYRALDSDLNREVAIKFLATAEGETVSELEVARFKRETAVLMSLSHPSIIKVYDAGESGGKLYYVMELLKAQDLRQLLLKNTRLAPQQALAVLDQILDALDYIHDKGLVHRDMKPANVMVEESGRAVLMDFGIVRKLEGTVLTMEGKAIGTPRYLAPESVRGEGATPLVDLFATGVVAFEMFKGEPPFDAKSIAELAVNILQQPTPPLDEQALKLPAGTEAMVRKLLEKDPQARWPSARQARRAVRLLRGIVDDDETEEQPVAPSTPRVTRAGRRVSTRKVPGVTGPASGGPAGRSRLVVVLPLIAALVGFLAVAVPRLLTPPAVPGPSQPSTSRPSKLSMKYVELDRLAIEFTTATPCRWELDLGRDARRTESEPGVQHRFEVEVDPWQPAEGMALVSQGQRVDLTPPSSPGELIRRLHRAVKKYPVREETVESIWGRIREKIETRHPGVSQKRFIEVVRREPALAGPLDQTALDIYRFGKAGESLGETLDVLRPFVARALAARSIPDSILEELVHSLGQLDLVDGLANFLGVPTPFRIQQAMAPTFSVQLRPAAAMGGATAMQRQILPGLDGKAIWLLSTEEYRLTRSLGRFSKELMSTDLRHRERRQCDRFTFDDSRNAGAGGKRLIFTLTDLAPQAFMRLVPPRMTAHLPVRLPDGSPSSPADTIRLVATIAGPIGHKTGSWTIVHGHFGWNPARSWFGIDELLVEPLP
ncbi:MAG: protein kinase [Candidatus Riflebacteria bacterium]|nr:protein kinase [Candidatus Riflebacteria bacterium]